VQGAAASGPATAGGDPRMTQERHDTNDRRLDARLRGLPPELPPARDLWPSIEARLDRPARVTPAPARRRPAWPLLALAASVAVVGVLVVNLLHEDAPLPPGAAPDTAQPTAQHVAPAAPFGPAYD